MHSHHIGKSLQPQPKFFLKDSCAMNSSESKSPVVETWSAGEAGDHAPRGIMQVFEGRIRPQVLSFLHHALQQSGQKLPKHHIKPLSSLLKKSRMEWGEHQAQHSPVRMPLTKVPREGSGFMNTWEQACELVSEQFQHIIKGFSQVNENQSSRPKHLFWKYLFFKDSAF